MGTESVKGNLLVGAVALVRRVRDSGRLSAEAMAARLGKTALDLVDRKIEVASWYPVDAFCELIDLAWEVDGGRDPDYLEQQGAVSADRLFDSGRYQQLEFAERSRKADSRRQLIRQARLISTITGAFYDFVEVRVAIDGDRLCVIYGNARAFGDPLIHTTVGFKNQINLRQGSARRWSGERIRPDEVCFSMALPERLREAGEGG